MEEQFKNLDKLTRKLVKESGIHKPSANFLNNVMLVVEQKRIKQAYRPLISRSNWFVIGALSVVLMTVLSSFQFQQLSFILDFQLSEKLNFQNPFSEIKLSKTLIYGIGFLGLFLVQIPFLKRFFERQYLP